MSRRPITAEPVRVLHVDDYDGFASELARFLERDNRLTVIGRAHDGAEAVELARALRPDVVLMDIRMPGMSGLEATERILCGRPTTRVIVLSASDPADWEQQARAAGASTFVPKEHAFTHLVPAILAAYTGESVSA